MSQRGSRPSKGHPVQVFFGLVALGLVLGAGIGALTGYGTYQPCKTNDYGCFDLGRGFNEFFGALVGAPVGALAIPILWLLWRTGRRFMRRVHRHP